MNGSEPTESADMSCLAGSQLPNQTKTSSTLSKSDQSQNVKSDKTLRERPLTPKLSQTFTASPIKIHPLPNNKTEGFCQGEFFNKNRLFTIHIK